MYLSLFFVYRKTGGQYEVIKYRRAGSAGRHYDENKTRYAVAVRKPDQQIEVCVKEYKGIIPGRVYIKCRLSGEFLIFIDSLVLE